MWQSCCTVVWDTTVEGGGLAQVSLHAPAVPGEGPQVAAAPPTGHPAEAIRALGVVGAVCWTAVTLVHQQFATGPTEADQGGGGRSEAAGLACGPPAPTLASLSQGSRQAGGAVLQALARRGAVRLEDVEVGLAPVEDVQVAEE